MFAVYDSQGYLVRGGFRLWSEAFSYKQAYGNSGWTITFK